MSAETAALQRRLDDLERRFQEIARRNHLAVNHVATFGNCTHPDCRPFYRNVKR